MIEKRAKSKVVVYARVDITPGGDIEKTVTVLAYWFQKGKPAVAQRRFCQRCTDPMLRTTAEELMVALTAGQTEPEGKLKLTSTPEGAQCVIDGKPAGVTPLDKPLAAGPHEVVIEHSGHDAETRFITVKPSETVTVEVSLVVTVHQGGSKTKLLPLAVMGAGGAMFLTGAIMYAIDQDPSRDGDFTIRNTAPAGIGIGIAGLAIAAGGYLWYRSASKHESAPVAAVTHEGAYIGWTGRF